MSLDRPPPAPSPGDHLPDPRYPGIRVSLSSENPLAWVSAVRLALRRAGADQSEIARFSQEALTSENGQEMRQQCRRWVRLKRRG